MELTKKRNSGLFPLLKNDFTNGFFTPRLFDFDDNFWTRSLDTPPANIKETDKDFKLELSAPGMSKGDFKIDVEDGVLTISSEKTEESKDEDKNYKRREFSYSSFSRSFPLSENIDENNINAKYDNGILQVTIPKKETSVSRPKKQIKVV
jgi:HSP20 family protein